jgi:ParB family chromosome partitioning protein
MKSEIKKIKIEDIIVPEERVRAYQDQESETAFRSSSKKWGILHNIIVRRKNGKYELIAGESRLKYAKENGETEIDARVFEDLGDADAILMSLAENRARGSLDIKEFMNMIERLIDLGYNQREIADLTGYSYDYIRDISRLRKAPEPIKEALFAGAIDRGIAERLLQIKDEEKMMEALDEVVSMKETHTPADRALYIDRAYLNKCDMCGKQVQNLLQTAAGFLCEECARKVAYKPAEPTTPKIVLQFCSVGYHDVRPEDIVPFYMCRSCENKLKNFISIMRNIYGYSFEKLKEEDMKKILEDFWKQVKG